MFVSHAANSLDFAAPDFQGARAGAVSSGFVAGYDGADEPADDLAPARGVVLAVIAGLMFWAPIVAWLVR